MQFQNHFPGVVQHLWQVPFPGASLQDVELSAGDQQSKPVPQPSAGLGHPWCVFHARAVRD